MCYNAPPSVLLLGPQTHCKSLLTNLLPPGSSQPTLHALQTRFGWTVHADDFPNSVLNGVPLDLFNLYRAVVARGGFRMGNAINWKGEIFTKMANWTADHKMTGVGNALKRHYKKNAVGV